jgi:plasmid stabilization system protein ParE
MNIGIYIAGDNPVRAFSFTEELENKAMSLSSMPFKGVRRDIPVPNLRLVPHGAYNMRESDISLLAYCIQHATFHLTIL